MELFSHMTTFVTVAKLQLPHYSDIHAYAILVVHTRHNNSLQEHIQLNDTQNLILNFLEPNSHQVIIHL
jgi:hypothetical protein